MSEQTLREEFHSAMLNIFEQSREFDMFADDAIQKLKQDGGVQTAKRLIAETSAKAGLMRLWEAERLDISVEALILNATYRSLFSGDELEKAVERLKWLGYETSPADLDSIG